MSDLYSSLLDHLFFLVWICGIPVHYQYVVYLLQVQHFRALEEDTEKKKNSKASVIEQISQDSSAKYEVLSVNSFPSSQDTAFPVAANMSQREIEEEDKSMIEGCTQASSHVFPSLNPLAASTKWPTFNETERERKAYFKDVAQCLLHQVGKRCAQFSATLQACRGTEESAGENDNFCSDGVIGVGTCATSSSSPLQGHSTKKASLPNLHFDTSSMGCSCQVSEVVALSVEQSSLCHHRRTSKSGEQTEIEKNTSMEQSNTYGGGDALVWVVHRLPLPMSASLHPNAKTFGGAGHPDFEVCCDNPSLMVSTSASQLPVCIEVLALYTPEAEMDGSKDETESHPIERDNTPPHGNRDGCTVRVEEKRKGKNRRSDAEEMEEKGENGSATISASHPISSTTVTPTAVSAVMCSRFSKDSPPLPSMLWRQRASETALQVLYHARAVLESSSPVSSTNENFRFFEKSDEVASGEKEKLGSGETFSSVATPSAHHSRHPFFFTRLSPLVTASLQGLVPVDLGGPTLLPLPSALPKQRRESRKTKRKTTIEIPLVEKELGGDKKKRRLCGVQKAEFPYSSASPLLQTRLVLPSSSSTPSYVVIDDVENEGSTDQKYPSLSRCSRTRQATDTHGDSECLPVEVKSNHTVPCGVPHPAAAAEPPELQAQERRASVSEKECWALSSLSSCSLFSLKTNLENEEVTAHAHDFCPPTSASKEGHCFSFSRSRTPPQEKEAQSLQDRRNSDVSSLSSSRSSFSVQGRNSDALFSPSLSTVLSSSPATRKDSLLVFVSDNDDDNQRS